MSMIQIRNVPRGVHRTLKARAALAGMSLSDYLLHELNGLASRPSWEDMERRLAALPAARSDESAATAVRRERAARR